LKKEVLSKQHQNVVVDILKQKNILPVTRFKNAKLLSRIIAYCFSNVFLSKDLVIFIGNRESLYNLQKDLLKLNIESYFDKDIIYRNEKISKLYCCDVGFILLLRYLGAPEGNKISQNLKIPKWIM